jgi:hypothetical protein
LRRARWGNLFFLFLSDLSWVLRDSGVLQCRSIMFPWGVKDDLKPYTISVLSGNILVLLSVFLTIDPSTKS